MMYWILFLKFQIARQPIMKNKDGSRMGKIIQYRLLQSEIQVGLMRPVIYCNERYCENLQQVALNEKLAALLLKIKPERRTMRIKRCFQEVLTNIPENSCIRDFDVLFNPAYKIDVLQLLTVANRSKACFVLHLYDQSVCCNAEE